MLSIVIASYNTRDITRRCLEAVAADTAGLDYEVVVVDNGSTDDSAAMIEREFPWVQLIRNTENRGFAAAQNVGLQRARGRYLLVLNSDVLLVGRSAAAMVHHLQSGPSRLGAVGPQVLNPDGHVTPSARRALLPRPVLALGVVNRHFSFKRLLPEAWMQRRLGFLLGRLHDNYVTHSSPREADFVDGMCVLFKREALQETGLFDEQFFFDYEIVDLSNRLRALGWRIAFCPEARAIHLGHASRRQVRRTIVETHRSELIYHAKYAPQYIPFLRRITIAVVRLRMLTLRARLCIRPRDARAREYLGLCQDIVCITRQFQPSSVWRDQRIPALDRQRAG